MAYGFWHLEWNKKMENLIFLLSYFLRPFYFLFLIHEFPYVYVDFILYLRWMRKIMRMYDSKGWKWRKKLITFAQMRLKSQTLLNMRLMLSVWGSEKNIFRKKIGIKMFLQCPILKCRKLIFKKCMWKFNLTGVLDLKYVLYYIYSIAGTVR